MHYVYLCSLIILLSIIEFDKANCDVATKNQNNMYFYVREI